MLPSSFSGREKWKFSAARNAVGEKENKSHFPTLLISMTVRLG